MNLDAMQQCADLIVADVAQDAAMRTGRSTSEILELVVTSKAYELLYDFETGLWSEGPDAFAALIDFEG